MTDNLEKNQSSLTPMLQQYFQLKEQAEEAILFFRMGDFYEIFGEDAEHVAPILDIVLTSREKGRDSERIPFCGVPHHSAKSYFFKLLSKGYKVAIADQMEDSSAAKGLVRREITKIMTPGCIDELEGLDPQQANYLIAIYEDATTKKLSVVMTDISTGEFKAGFIRDFAQFSTLLETYEPREILCRRFFAAVLKPHINNYLVQRQIAFSYLNEHIIAATEEQRNLVRQVFGSDQVGVFADNPEAKFLLPLVAGVLRQITANLMSVKQFRTIRPLMENTVPVLDEYALRDLEIFETQRRRQSGGSLYSIINRAMTPMGTRLLRHNLSHPLADLQAINRKLDQVDEFFKLGEMALAQLRSRLSGMADLERLAIRIGNAKVSPGELAKVRQSLMKLLDFLGELASLNIDFYGFTGDAGSLKASAQHIYTLLAEALQDDVGVIGSGSQVFRKGFNQSLDRLVALAHDGSTRVEEYAEKLRQETGISTLKIREHKSFGLLIEVTRSHLNKVPSFFVRRQTMVNNERFTTPDLKELEEVLVGASAEAASLEQELYLSFITDLSSYSQTIAQLATMIANIDTDISSAWLAIKHDLVRPSLSEHGLLNIKGGRHLVVETMVGNHAFTANDIHLDKKQPQVLITGPNMAGKSTFMRQIALIAIMGQMGSYVPAFAAELPVFDRIFTRVGASDDLALGQSTFMVEMTESAHILREATTRSLVVLDEVGRGTSTSDGLALAAGILDTIARHIQCYCLFSTHYHELVAFSKGLKTLKLMRAEVLETEDGIEFTHKISTGYCDSSFGLEVARLAGIPSQTLKKATEYLMLMDRSNSAGVLAAKGKGVQAVLGPLGDGLSAETEDSLGSKQKAFLERAQNEQDLQIFYQIKNTLLNVSINKMTPLQALNLLASIQQDVVNPVTKAKGLFDRGFLQHRSTEI